MSERMDDMLARYGECVKKKKAAEILDVHPHTVSKMVLDGRLKLACEGTKVDVRSIADYLERPAQMNEIARLRKRREKAGIKCRFSV